MWADEDPKQECETTKLDWKAWDKLLKRKLR